MKIKEIINTVVGLRMLNESDVFVMGMANFLSDVTDLPANLVLWTKPQPNELPHNKYRIKVFKDRIHCATFSIGQQPHLLWEITNKQYRLDQYETGEVQTVINNFSSLFIQYIDSKLSTDLLKQEMKKVKG